MNTASGSSIVLRTAVVLSLLGAAPLAGADARDSLSLEEIVVTATAPSPYGWVGSAMRSSANQGGLIQMGARMYNPATGRFLTTDPVPGRTPNPSTYPPDPVNMYDLAGTWSIGGAIQNILNTGRGSKPKLFRVDFDTKFPLGEVQSDVVVV